MVKVLNGANIAGFVKNQQAVRVRAMRAKKLFPRLVIVRGGADAVIDKYVGLKKQYGADIGVAVDEVKSEHYQDLQSIIRDYNLDPKVHGIILQLPIAGLKNHDWKLQELLDMIAPEKDVDGLGAHSDYDSATATAINWLMGSYGIDLGHEKIALVGRGRLVGAPLEKIWKNSGFSVEVFGRDADLTKLANFRIIVSATGVANLVKSEMIAPDSVVVDAGTASEGGKVVGDVAEEVRERKDIKAITPKIGGVGPLTVAVLFEHLLNATEKTLK